MRTWITKIRELQPSPDFKIISYVIVGITDNTGETSNISGVTPLLARMAKESLTEIGSKQARAATDAAETYSLSSHGISGNTANSQTSSASYAVSGMIKQCREQLLKIAEQGCDELVVILGSVDTPTSQLVRDIRLFGSEILPELELL